MSFGEEKIVGYPFESDPNFKSLTSKPNVYSLIFENNVWRSDSLALVDVISGAEIRYRELIDRVNQFARSLTFIGCRRGDVIALFSPNSFDWMVVFLAAIRLGVVAAGINHLLSPAELKHQLNSCKARFVFTDRELAKEVIEIRRTSEIIKEIIVKGGYDGCVCFDSMLQMSKAGLPVLPGLDVLNIKRDDECVIFFSSGTTGPQKAVTLANRCLLTGYAITCDPRLDILFPGQLIFSPFSHVTGALATMYGLVRGVTNYLLTRFDFQRFLEAIEKYQLEGMIVVPPIATLMAKHPLVDKYRMTSLKQLVIGAAHCGREVEDQLLERFPGIRVRQIYGMTECTGFSTNVPVSDPRISNRRKPGSVGISVDGLIHKIVDINTGACLGANQAGEILIKGDTVMLGYRNQPDVTAATIDRDGWLHSGDIGYYDEDGYFFVVDRIKELIKFNAYQVAPAELEAVLLSHPMVADAGVVGIPDAASGELPAAWVVKKSGANLTENELNEYVTDKVAPFKKLRGGIRFVESIPKSASGKILRREIRNAYLKHKL